MATEHPKNGWQKFTAKKPAVFGLGIIAISIIVALFAYWIAPDATPDANRMIVEIGGRKPGFKQQFFLLPKENNIHYNNWIRRTFSGQPDAVQFIPVEGYSL